MWVWLCPIDGHMERWVSNSNFFSNNRCYRSALSYAASGPFVFRLLLWLWGLSSWLMRFLLQRGFCEKISGTAQRFRHERDLLPSPRLKTCLFSRNSCSIGWFAWLWICGSRDGSISNFCGGIVGRMTLSNYIIYIVIATTCREGITAI